MRSSRISVDALPGHISIQSCIGSGQCTVQFPSHPPHYRVKCHHSWLNEVSGEIISVVSYLTIHPRIGAFLVSRMLSVRAVVHDARSSLASPGRPQYVLWRFGELDQVLERFHHRTRHPPKASANPILPLETNLHSDYARRRAVHAKPNQVATSTHR